MKAVLAGIFIATLAVSQSHAQSTSRVYPNTPPGGATIFNDDGSSSRILPRGNGSYDQFNSDGSDDDIRPNNSGGYTVFHHDSPFANSNEDE